jgi:CysZ protein
VSFFLGLGCFFRGFTLLARAPGALPLALVPAGVALAISAGFLSLVFLWVPDWVEQWVGTGGFWVGVLKVIATATAAVLSVLVALALAQPASGPALEGIVRRVERELGAPPSPESPFLVEVLRSAGSAAIGLGAAITSFVVLFLLGLIPGAVVVTVPLQFIAAAFCIGWDVCDFPLGIRGATLSERLSFVAANARAVLGLSAGVALCSVIPCGLLLVLPVGVAGATALVHEITQRGGGSRPALPPVPISPH